MRPHCPKVPSLQHPNSDFGTFKQLAAHKHALHTESFNSSSGSVKLISTTSNSTRDNSIFEQLMIEDISIINTNDRPDIQESSELLFKCDVCEFTTEYGNKLLDHESANHQLKPLEDKPTNEVAKEEDINIVNQAEGSKEESTGMVNKELAVKIEF